MLRALISRAVFALCLFLVLQPNSVAAPASGGLKIIAGGRELSVQAVSRNGQVFLPIQAVKSLGVKVAADTRRGHTPRACITSAQGTARLTAQLVDGKPMLAVKDVSKTLDIATKLDRSNGTLALLGRIRRISFDGRTLLVTTSIPVSASVMDTDWTRSINRIVLNLQGAVLPSAEPMLVTDSPAPYRISVGILDDGTARIVVRMPPHASVGSMSRPGSGQIALSLDIKGERDVHSLPPMKPVPVADTNPVPSTERPTVNGLECRRSGRRSLDVLISADGRSDYRLRTLTNPDRIVMDIRSAQVQKDVADVDLDGRIASGVKIAKVGRSARVTVALAQPASASARWDEASSQYVLTIRTGVKTGESIAGKTIVIDPGHGGGDGGCPGCGEKPEKTITLEIALRVQKALADAGVRALLTRSTDVGFERLADRVEFARRNSADIFVSIHCNSASSDRAGQAQGIETFYHVSDPDSKSLADSIQSEVMKSVQAADRGSKPDTDLHDTGLGVLRGSSAYGIPSSLIEVGFIDNQCDIDRACDPGSQQKLAEAIVSGIRSFISGAPTSTRTPRVRRPRRTALRT